MSLNIFFLDSQIPARKSLLIFHRLGKGLTAVFWGQSWGRDWDRCDLLIPNDDFCQGEGGSSALISSQIVFTLVLLTLGLLSFLPLVPDLPSLLKVPRNCVLCRFCCVNIVDFSTFPLTAWDFVFSGLLNPLPMIHRFFSFQNLLLLFPLLFA